VGGSLRHPNDEVRTRKPGGALHGKPARRLRNESTAWERRLWVWLRTLRKTHGFHFRRQLPLGRFVADFGCHSIRLIIELDGPFHDPQRDSERDAWFAKVGYRTPRFPNEMVVGQWDRVIADIRHELGVGSRLDGPLACLQQPPTPNPSPQGGGEPARTAPDSPTPPSLRDGHPPQKGEGRGARG
jgi:very-short-patch-repair endonuclease